MSKKGRLKLPDRRSTGREWVGARVTSPFYITEDVPYRPEMILWLEMPGITVISFELIDPGEDPVSLADSLLKTIESPQFGPPRRPDLVRVDGAELAAEIRQALPGVRVIDAPTPEVNEVLDAMSQGMAGDDPGEEPSYFSDGRIGEDTVASLFRSARVLYSMAPWKVASDGVLLRLDIPDYHVNGAALSIIGRLGESVGLLIFPSIEGFHRFMAAAEHMNDPEAPIDVGTSSLCLNFQKGSTLPESMRREIKEHAWPVASPKAYPVVQHRERDGIIRPLTEMDVRVVSACASSLTAFFVQNRELFRHEIAPEPVCASFLNEDGLEVRYTLPYEAWDLFPANRPGVRRSKALSGRKSKGRGRKG